MNKAEITYSGFMVIVACDRNCKKAWGINCRPFKQLSDDEDDIYWLSDSEIKEDAPEDPGTYEADCGKPYSPDDFPNKWCVRECERSEIFKPNEEIKLEDWSKGVYNIPQK